eukprot:Sdes_comp23505_c0_seq1m21733
MEVFVTLYQNDGMMETSTAKPFMVFPNIDISQLRIEAYKFLYQQECFQAKLFTSLGVEIQSLLEVYQHNCLIVSDGSPFLSINYSSKMPSLELEQFPEINSVLRDIYTHPLQ